MNSTIESIMKRRSVRFYDKKRVERSDLETIINAGNHAPTGSGGNWRFVVISDNDVIQKMSTITIPYYEGFMQQAPDMFKEVRKEIDAIVDDPIYYNASNVVFVISDAMTAMHDCPMVCQNMMIAAQSLNIGSCWTYFGQMAKDHPYFAEILKIDDGEQIFGPIIFGHPTEQELTFNSKNPPQIDWN